MAIDLREHPAVLSCNDAQAIRDAALAGVGISLQGDHMASDPVADGWMIELLPDWRLPVFDVHLLWLPGADRDPALRCLVDFLAKALTGEGCGPGEQGEGAKMHAPAVSATSSGRGAIPHRR